MDAPRTSEAQEQDRRQRWAAITPAERFRWLERSIRFAGAAGTLPRRRPSPEVHQSGSTLDEPG